MLKQKVEELTSKLADLEVESLSLRNQSKKQEGVLAEMSARHDRELGEAKAEAKKMLEDSDNKYLSGRRGVLEEILKARLSCSDIQRLLDDLRESDSEEMDADVPS